jgi:hypothetical protein
MDHITSVTVRYNIEYYNIMRLLELFSGTKSVGAVASDLGYNVISLDRDMDADIKTDIMDWMCDF